MILTTNVGYEVGTNLKIKIKIASHSYDLLSPENRCIDWDVYWMIL